MNKEQVLDKLQSVKLDRRQTFTDGVLWAVAVITAETHPHSTYMEFAEWCIEQKVKKIHNGDNEVLYFDYQEFFEAPDLFQYWITNVKNKR